LIAVHFVEHVLALQLGVVEGLLLDDVVDLVDVVLQQRLVLLDGLLVLALQLLDFDLQVAQALVLQLGLDVTDVLFVHRR
jgi:hypothetical protein